MVKNLKQNKGITLIALVITIIVIIILSAITINAVVGDNGIISETKQARDDYHVAENEEQETLDSAVSAIRRAKQEAGFINNGSSSSNNSNNNNNNNNNSYSTPPETTGALGTATNTTNYGRVVSNYTASDLVWRLFYEDSNNYYLISETATGGYPVTMSGVCTLSDNSYGAKVSTFEGGISVSAQGQALMPLAGGATSSLVGTNSSGINLFTSSNRSANIAGACYTCDTSSDGAWAQYKTGPASWAMGGPTLELYAASYNATHSTNQLVLGMNSYGYTANNVNLVIAKDYNGIYKLKGEDETGAWAWWIASPGDSGAMNWGMYDKEGVMGNFTCELTLNFRPVVCISKSIGFTCQYQ